jgi:K(+)-stimulated pyrophosphate-energized sodium pump
MLQTDISVLVIASVPFLGGLIALAFTVYLNQTVSAAPHSDPEYEGKEGTDQQLQKQISDTIQNGAMAFLQEEYYYLLPFVAGMSLFFFVEEGIACNNKSALYAFQCNTAEFPGNAGYRMVICFIIGAILSATAGYAGMLVATECNVKASQAAKGPAANGDKDNKEDTGLNDALEVAFAGGAVMGFTVVGLGLTGLTILFALFARVWENDNMKGVYINQSLQYMAAFSFGASAIALFARVAGGIYTKAADVGADLVGKVESDFPEDSYYNPATVADNVGDNVGDVAGMGADLFESYVGSIVAAATLAMTVTCTDYATSCAKGAPDYRRVALPFWVAGFGVVASVIGTFFVSTDQKMTNEDGSERKAGEVLHDLLSSLHRGVYGASILGVGLSALAVGLLFEGDNDTGFRGREGWYDFICIIIGLLTGIIIGEATEYFTAYEFSPTRSITKAGVTGPATVIIQGLGIGMLSAVPPVIVIVVAVVACSALSGVYGAAVAAVGMLSTLGVTLATDAYGPVADNAGGVAEMAHLPPQIRAKTDALDALGNTTAATGKGFAVGSAVLTALAFMNAFSDQVRIQICTNAPEAPDCKEFADFFAITNPLVLSGLLIGAMLPFLFAALTMLSVGTAATGIIIGVRDQLHGKPPEGPGIKKKAGFKVDPASLTTEGGRIPFLLELGIQSSKESWVENNGPTQELKDRIAASGVKIRTDDADDVEVKVWTDIKPRTSECVTVCTQASLKEMILPGVLAIFTPLGLGLLVGARCLGGILMGAIASGFLLAVMMNNAGGAWDNAKKFVENDHPDLGHGPIYKSGHDKCTDDGKWHAAVVVGDTVGDPFKDTSGPALNILIKLMSVLSLTCAKIFRNDWETWWIGLIVIIIEIILCTLAYMYVWSGKDDDLAEKDEKETEEEQAPQASVALDDVKPVVADAPAATEPAAEETTEEAPADEEAPAEEGN